MFKCRELKKFLIDKWISQGQSAQHCGCTSPSTISAILNGWQPIGKIVSARLKAGMNSVGASDIDIRKVFGGCQ